MSTTYAAAIMSFLTLLAAVFKFELPESVNEVSITQAVALVIGLVATCKILINRYRNGGVNLLGIRK